MTLVKRGRFFHYTFHYKKRRYRGSTGQERREDAERVEQEIKRRRRQEAWGVAPFDREHTPSFSAWAEVFIQHKRQRLTRPDVLERTVRMVLAFWGTTPTRSTPVDGGVYHDLRLADPILDPEWIDKFEAWMSAPMGKRTTGLSASAKNSYRSALSGMFKLAKRPRFRRRFGIMVNPFEDIDRDVQVKRRLKVSAADVRAWISHAAPHAVLAMTIGALAPKLRLGQVLALRFDEHLNEALTTITFNQFKSARHRAGKVQVTAVADDLRAVLQAIQDARPSASHVITFRGEPVDSIKRACITAASRANLAWGLKAGGLTFHALRHAFATEAARIGISQLLAGKALDHADARTTEQFYTHLEVEDERPVMNRMAAHLRLRDIAVKAAGATSAPKRKMTPGDLERIRATAKRFKGGAKSA